MCSPGRIGTLAKPMICPNFRTGAPSAISTVAILWPFGTRNTAVTPSATAPGRLGSIETIRWSSGWRRSTRGAFARSDRPGMGRTDESVVVIGGERLRGGRFQRGILVYGGAGAEPQNVARRINFPALKMQLARIR